MNTRMIPFAVLLGGGAAYLLYVAFKSGNPLHYFLSAVGLGIAFAALQKR